jgi:low temperature requirement protein LtrA
LSRVAFNFLHPVIVAGVVVTSAADERLLREPGASATTVDVLLTLGGPALFLAGHAAYKALLWRTLPISRVTAVVVLLALMPAAVALRVPVALAAGVALLITGGVIVADRVSARRAAQSRGPRSPLR